MINAASLDLSNVIKQEEQVYERLRRQVLLQANGYGAFILTPFGPTWVQSDDIEYAVSCGSKIMEFGLTEVQSWLREAKARWN